MARSRRTQDSFGRKARREGFPARSVYKLEEIDRRVRALHAGQRVLDLGAAPGSWTLYASSKVGSKGRVISIDLSEVRGAMPPNVEWRVGDVATITADELGGVGAFDVVLSDMAPSTTGQRSVDQYRSYELFMHALRIADQTLATKGAFVGKIFQGAEFTDARKSVAALFDEVRIVRPKATRTESYETFLVGLGRKS